MNASASPAPKHDAAATSYSAAVMRSSELLSCARSALKILLQQQSPQSPKQLRYASPSELYLFDITSIDTNSPMQLLQHDCSTLLHQMHSQLTWLGSLVKRAGHSNDPTHDITTATQQLEAATQQLQALLQPHLTAANAVTQKQKHLHQMARQCQAVAAQYGQRLQTILKLRASVLSQQQKRRQQFSSAGSNTSAAALNRNPLFAAKPLQATQPAASPYHAQPNGNGSIRPAAAPNPYGISKTQNGGYGGGGTATASYYNSYGGGSGYGGTASSSTMRRRPGAAGSGGGYHHTSQQQSQPVMDQDQLLVQRQERQSAQRLRDARHTERALHQISGLFGKMSGLIQQQAEVLDKIEDDVEAASCDVKAGQDEMTTLYTIKKGNRGLILKVFGLLIFLICFLRLYKK